MVVANDLQSQQNVLRVATEETLTQLKDLCTSLSHVSKPEKKDVLEREVQEIETRLLELNNLLDEKIRRLLEQNNRIGALGDQIAQLRDWMLAAQAALQHLLTVEMSPEERVRQTHELQKQIAEKMKELEGLEKEVGGDEDSKLMEQMDTLKEEMLSLNDTVKVQAVETSEALEVFTHCKSDLEKVNPWLEKAELKLAMGLGRPSTLEESKLMAQQIQVRFCSKWLTILQLPVFSYNTTTYIFS